MPKVPLESDSPDEWPELGYVRHEPSLSDLAHTRRQTEKLAEEINARLRSYVERLTFIRVPRTPARRRK